MIETRSTENGYVGLPGLRRWLNFAFCAYLLATVSACEEKQQIDGDGVAHIAVMVHGIQLQRDQCVALSPTGGQEFVEAYGQSTVPKYAEALQYERSFDFGDRQSVLESLGVTAAEADTLCNEEYPELLRQFDSLYAGRVDEVVAALPELVDAAEKSAIQRANERRSLSGEQNDALFNTIATAVNQSFDAGDWSILAARYPAGTFDCWTLDGSQTDFAFLAKSPIPPDAKHEIKPLNGPYTHGTMIGAPPVAVTHLMRVWFEVSYPSKCSDEESHRWPTYHFLLSSRDQGYDLVHGCPTPYYYERLEISPVWRSLSRDEVEMKLRTLPAEEWNLVPAEIRGNRSARRTHSRLQNQYDLSNDEANLIIDEICREPDER